MAVLIHTYIVYWTGVKHTYQQNGIIPMYYVHGYECTHYVCAQHIQYAKMCMYCIIYVQYIRTWEKSETCNILYEMKTTIHTHVHMYVHITVHTCAQYALCSYLRPQRTRGSNSSFHYIHNLLPFQVVLSSTVVPTSFLTTTSSLM